MRSILCFVAVAFTLALKAQYVITATTSPVAGDIHEWLEVDTTGIIFPASGQNKLWNYSNLVIDYSVPVFSSTYIPISSVPNNTLFSGATIGCLNSSYGMYGYEVFKITSSSIGFLGTVDSSASNSYTYSNPITQVMFPFTYGSGYSDTYYSGSFNLSGTVTPLGNGTGTLMLPGFTFTNVLKVTTNRTDLFSYPTGTQTIIFESHSFYAANSKFPLLTINSTTETTIPPYFYDGIKHGVSINRAFVLNAGVKEYAHENTFTIYPNPVKDGIVHIDLNNSNSIAKMQLTNILGQIIKEQIIEKTNVLENKIDLDLKDVLPGIYYLTLQTVNGSCAKKLVIE